jgi:hypothetical protein
MEGYSITFPRLDASTLKTNASFSPFSALRYFIQHRLKSPISEILTHPPPTTWLRTEAVDPQSSSLIIRTSVVQHEYIKADLHFRAWR